ncbi:hypothetical protein [Nocardia africana]|uniref:Uncharacterized protein n=1 Tax=Nocardia africana TaxID=134964 RepID=A0A378WQX0_9NOCA|nr:hypothetical protein [Nocardia africana]MCC3314113.1 hypothetical protein [Nocardia africana]SUA43638.1 Uncharacterised protein [Nocardia africana]
MKQLYARTSIMSSVERLDSTVRAAITAHAEVNSLGDVLTSATTVCETRSVRLYRNGLLAKVTGSGDPDREHRTIAMIIPACLVIAVVGEKRGIHVRSARLEAISLNPGIAAALDSGISVVAHWSGQMAHDAPAGFFLGLGNDEDGRAFLGKFREAVAGAKTR